MNLHESIRKDLNRLDEASTREIEKAIEMELKGRKGRVLTARQWSEILFYTHRDLGLIHATKLEPILKNLGIKLKK